MTLQEAIQVIDEIKSDYDADVIKDYEIPPLMNINTGKETGFGVKLRLNTKYDYDDDTLNSWKKKLKADSWYIHVRSNQLFVMYKIHYRIPNEELERKALVEQIQKEGSQLADRIAKMEVCSTKECNGTEGSLELHLEVNPKIQELIDKHTKHWQDMIDEHNKKFGLESIKM